MNKSLNSEELVSVVKVVFHALQTLIFSRSQWNEIGGWKGFLNEYRISIRDVKGLERTTMSRHDFVDLGEWNP